MVLFAGGYGQKDVAGVLGCDVKTLRKVFSRECAAAARAALVVRSGMMAALVDEGEKGSVGAIKQLDRMIEAERLRVASKAAASAPPAKAPKLGKKAELEQAAREQRGLYQPPEAPQLLN